MLKNNDALFYSLTSNNSSLSQDR